MALNFGITSITFFGADSSTQTYFDRDGRLRYERNRSGAEFIYEVTLGASRSISIRTVVFDNSRSLNDLELDAVKQLKRILIELGKAGKEIIAEPPKDAAENETSE